MGGPEAVKRKNLAETLRGLRKASIPSAASRRTGHESDDNAETDDAGGGGGGACAGGVKRRVGGGEGKSGVPKKKGMH